MAYPLAQLRSEVTFIAYHLHWSLEEIQSLPHRDRIEWVNQISAINKRILESDH